MQVKSVTHVPGLLCYPCTRAIPNRQPNFDIYLPRWLARYNKEIFGPLYFVGIGFTLLQWLNARG